MDTDSWKQAYKETKQLITESIYWKVNRTQWLAKIECILTIFILISKLMDGFSDWRTVLIVIDVVVIICDLVQKIQCYNRIREIEKFMPESERNNGLCLLVFNIPSINKMITTCRIIDERNIHSFQATFQQENVAFAAHMLYVIGKIILIGSNLECYQPIYFVCQLWYQTLFTMCNCKVYLIWAIASVFEEYILTFPVFFTHLLVWKIIFQSPIIILSLKTIYDHTSKFISLWKKRRYMMLPTIDPYRFPIHMRECWELQLYGALFGISSTLLFMYPENWFLRIFNIWMVYAGIKLLSLFMMTSNLLIWNNNKDLRGLYQGYRIILYFILYPIWFNSNIMSDVIVSS